MTALNGASLNSVKYSPLGVGASSRADGAPHSLPEHAPKSTWCECPVCGQGFGGITLFDTHRVGEHGVRNGSANRRRCLTVGEMAARGWTQDPKGLWRDLSRGSAPARRPIADLREGPNRLATPKSAIQAPRARTDAL